SALQSGLRLSFRSYACNEQIFTPTQTPTNAATNTPTNSPTNTPTPTGTNTSTATPTPLPCGAGSNYVVIATTGATLVAGTTDIGNHCFDCMTTVALPFTYSLYGQSFTTVNVSSHGN